MNPDLLDPFDHLSGLFDPDPLDPFDLVLADLYSGRLYLPDPFDPVRLLDLYFLDPYSPDLRFSDPPCFDLDPSDLDLYFARGFQVVSLPLHSCIAPLHCTGCFLELA